MTTRTCTGKPARLLISSRSEPIYRFSSPSLKNALGAPIVAVPFSIPSRLARRSQVLNSCRDVWTCMVPRVEFQILARFTATSILDKQPRRARATVACGPGRCQLWRTFVFDGRSELTGECYCIMRLIILHAPPLFKRKHLAFLLRLLILFGLRIKVVIT